MKAGIDEEGKEFIAYECLDTACRFEVILILPCHGYYEVHAKSGPLLYVGRGKDLVAARLNVIEKWLGIDVTSELQK